jgi:putative SbcD/Mre11-related phosphoesterase
MNYKFVNKSLFFPKEEILVIGDLHLGYETQMIKAGVLAPKTQMKKLISELNSLIKKLSPKKIIFIGDIKHSFKYEYQEKIDFQEVVDFLKQYFKEKDIIFIKGNHDTIDYSFKDKLKNYHIENNIAFLHGHKSFPEIYDKKIKTIVLGHLHPSIVLYDPDTTKREKFKCFLTGKFKGKQVIILPSFIGFTPGTSINDYSDLYGKDDFSIIPKNKILNFNVFVIGKNKIYDFKKLKKIKID